MKYCLWSFMLLSICYGQITCTYSTTEKPPFWVSEAMRKSSKTYTSVQSLDNDTNYVLSRRSIVTILDIDSTSSRLTPIKVLKANSNNKLDSNLVFTRELRNLSAQRAKQDKISDNDTGLIRSESLKPARDYSYIVSKSSSLEIDSVGTEEDFIAVRLSVNDDGLYDIETCCENNECTTRYKFYTVHENNTESGGEYVDPVACSAVESMTPFNNESASSILSILNMSFRAGLGEVEDLEYLDAKSFVKIPLEKVSDEGFLGPFNSFHYNADDHGSNDVYGDTTSVCTFMRVLEEHNRTCVGDGCEVQFGDFYSPICADKIKCPHSSHYTGECVDIRPFKKGDLRQAMLYTNKNAKRRIQVMIDFARLARRAGATQLIYNDKDVVTQVRGMRADRTIPGKITPYPHDNHLHLCFRKNSPIVQKTCQEGIPRN